MNERILIMTDSSCTISYEDAKKYEIEILPLTLERNDGAVFVDEPNQINAYQILEMLDQGYTFKTATTILGTMEKRIVDGLKTYQKIIVCPISSGWSSQYNHLNMIAKKYLNQVYVIDTKDFGYSLECLCIHLRKQLNNGVPFDEILDYAENHWKYSLCLFACKTLKGLEKSGRLPKIVAKALTITKIVPIIKAEYTNQKECLALGWNNVFDKFIKYTNKYYKNELNNTNVEKICILISEDISNDALKLKDILIQTYQLNESQIVYRWAPSVFLCLVWKGAIGITTISTIKKSILLNFKDKQDNK